MDLVLALPDELGERLDAAAVARGTTRETLIAEILETALPSRLSDDELTAQVNALIDEFGQPTWTW